MLTHNFNLKDEDFDTPIWRYINLAKFLDILENKRLFFSSIRNFEDKFEGYNTALTNLDLYDITDDGEFIQSIGVTADERVNDNSLAFKGYLAERLERFAKTVGVNCWRIDQIESHAMWRTFLATNEGVAIKSTCQQLKRSFKISDKWNLQLGKINYENLAKHKTLNTKNLLSCFFDKYNYFEHEKELRALIYIIEHDAESAGPDWISFNGSGHFVSVDPDELIEEVIVSPYAPIWFYDLISKLMNRYQLNAELKWSGIELNKF